MRRLFARSPKPRYPILEMDKLRFECANAPACHTLGIRSGILTTAMLDQRSIGCLEQTSPSRSPILIGK
jgi:hypothetical protein